MRDPSIHIKESELVLLLQEAIEKYGSTQIKNVAGFIVNGAKGKSCTNRCVIVSNKKLERAQKLTLSGRSEAMLFSQILVMTRRKFHHKGIEVIKPGAKEWPDIKDICKLATDFCNEFQISVREGYTEYCQIGMSMMKNYSLFKFKALHSAICKVYESKVELAEDSTPTLTDEYVSEYLRLVNERVGWISEDYKKNPEKKVCFKRAKEQGEKMKVSPKIYIEAQFKGMEWRQGIPDPFQLYGDKAIDRVVKYCYENNISLKQKVKKLDIKKIKRHGKNYRK